MTATSEKARRLEDERRVRVVLAEEVPRAVDVALSALVDRLPAEVRARLDAYAKAKSVSRIDAAAMIDAALTSAQ